MPTSPKEKSQKFITPEDVTHISKLCRLKLTEKEVDQFTTQFNDILAFFKKLDDIDTSNTPPMFHVMDVENVFRKDEVKPSLSEEGIFRNVSKREGRFIKAPRMT
ncbi:MAG: Asp-tRNA(Asn)/Glu-tRNA(Gln) amidotransferase subunit GatC [Candidatus Helarchaeota archaeon]